MSKTAVILFNLGGPDSPEAIEPFLFNLFSDPAILDMPRMIRWLVAKMIVKRRISRTRAIYGKVSHSSPIVHATEMQAKALETVLHNHEETIRVFPAMRYWHPFINTVAHDVKQWSPDTIVLLPLYPQFSTTTTESSMKEWTRVMMGTKIPTLAICCWPVEPKWILAVADLTQESLNKLQKCSVNRVTAISPRILFSAHALPEHIIARGDPYQHQVEQTAMALAAALKWSDGDYKVCYQSRVGSGRWIGPATVDLVRQAGSENVPIVLVPITFVSEHSETLVELDIEYRHVAKEAGVPAYIRVPTVGTHPYFIAGLADMVREAQARLSQGLEGLYGQGEICHCPPLRKCCASSKKMT